MDGSVIRNYFLRSGAWAFFGKVTSAFLGFATSTLLARVLSPQDMGSYFLVFNLATFFSIFARAGLENTLLRFIPKAMGNNQPDHARDFAQKGLILATCGVILVAGVVYTGAGQWLAQSLFRSAALSVSVGFIVIWLIVLTFQFMISAVFRAFQDIRSYVIFDALIADITTVAFLLFCWLAIEHAVTLRQVLMGVLTAGIVNIAAAAWVLKRKMNTLPQPTHVNETYQEIIEYTWPLFLNALVLFFMSQTDLWILARFRPPEDVAIYGIATRLVTLTSFLLIVVNVIVSPLIARLYVHEKERLERILRSAATLTAAPTLIVLTVFIFWGNPILAVAFGDYYRSSAVVLAILSVGQAVNVLVGSCGYLLVLTGHQKLVFKTNVFSIIIFLTLGIGLVNFFGATGVATALMLAMSYQQLSNAYFAKKYAGINTLPYLSIRNILNGIRG